MKKQLFYKLTPIQELTQLSYFSTRRWSGTTKRGRIVYGTGGRTWTGWAGSGASPSTPTPWSATRVPWRSLRRSRTTSGLRVSSLRGVIDSKMTSEVQGICIYSRTVFERAPVFGQCFTVWRRYVKLKSRLIHMFWGFSEESMINVNDKCCGH